MEPVAADAAPLEDLVLRAGEGASNKEIARELGTSEPTVGLWRRSFAREGVAGRLAAHLRRAPERQVTTLDCHDGIPVSPDLDGILAPAENWPGAPFVWSSLLNTSALCVFALAFTDHRRSFKRQRRPFVVPLEMERRRARQLLSVAGRRTRTVTPLAADNI